MKIQYLRSGGFSGMPVSVTVDTSSLPPETAQSFQQALLSSQFFELPDKLPAPSPGADQFTHRLTVDDEDRHHSIEMPDSAVPASLQPILRLLVRMARKQGAS